MKVPLLLGTALVLSSSTALADELTEVPEIGAMPIECMQYLLVHGDSDSPTAWNQVLSFAACVQDSSIDSVTEVEQLPALIERFEVGLAPAMQFYAAGFEHGPAPIQLRAAFQIGMAQVALITRARAALVVPKDRATNRKAAAHYRELQAGLEPLLEESAKLGWMLFVLIDRAVEEDPSIVVDDVTRYMVRASRDLERSLRWSMSLPLDETPSQVAVAENSHGPTSPL